MVSIFLTNRLSFTFRYKCCFLKLVGLYSQTLNEEGTIVDLSSQLNIVSLTSV